MPKVWGLRFWALAPSNEDPTRPPQDQIMAEILNISGPGVLILGGGESMSTEAITNRGISAEGS